MAIDKMPDKKPNDKIKEDEVIEFNSSDPRNRFRIAENKAEEHEKDTKFYTFEALGSQFIPTSEQIFEELASSMIGRIYAVKIQDGRVLELVAPKNKPLNSEQRKHLIEEIEKRIRN